MRETEINQTLRPEAQAFEFDYLTDSQKEAVNDILDKLVAAHSDLARQTPDRSNKKGSGSPWIFSVSEKNKNRVLLLSGGRGSGKTSVLFSLVNLFNSSCSDRGIKKIDNSIDELKKEPLKKNDPAELERKKRRLECSKELLSNIIEKMTGKKNGGGLKNKLIWLQPLEMETLPYTSNLLAAILNRVDEAVHRFRGDHPTIHQYPRLCPEEQDVLLEFTKLQQDVALAWNGNLEQHAANIDPDAYAVEVLRAEQSRLDLNGRIERSLNQLHHTFIKASYPGNECLFVLPVDDFDINPKRCLELIRMIRMLNVPRLFTLILGDTRIISHLLNLKFIESIVTLESKHGILFGNIPYDECRLSHELSANAIRKLFAVSSRVSLKAMAADEVFDFKAPGYHECIEDYLKRYVNIIINTSSRDAAGKAFIAKKSISSLYDLFNIKIDHLINNNLEIGRSNQKKKANFFYIRDIFFKMYPRHAQDLWIGLHTEIKKNEVDGDSKNAGNMDYLKFAEELYRDKIREGRDLTARISGFLNSILIKDFADQYQLDTSSLNLIYTYSQPIILEQNQKETFIGIFRPKNWNLKVVYPKNSADYPGMPNEIMLNDPTASGIVLMHDLLAFKNPNLIIGDKLMPKEAPLWAYTQWPYGSDLHTIKVPWYFPPWVTMFECDLLRRCWIEVWNWLSAYKEKVAISGTVENLKKSDNLISYITFCWLRIITDILLQYEDLDSSEDSENCFKMPSLLSADNINIDVTDQYETLVNNIINLSKFSTNQFERRRFIIRGWFAAIGCLLAPETNLTFQIRPDSEAAPPIDTILNKIAVKTEFREKLINPIIASGIRKLRARSAVLFFDNGALTLLNDLFKPRRKSTRKKNVQSCGAQLPDDEKACASESSVEFINEIGDGILRPYLEDIVMLSNQTPAKKIKYEKALMELTESSDDE